MKDYGGSICFMIVKLLLISGLLVGCASPCFIETGIGSYVNADESPNTSPTEINLYCETGNWEYGWYHDSDVSRGRPFNSQEEISTDKVQIKYKVRIK